MENSDALELNKFAGKAHGYKEALHYAPLARATEVLSIIGIIDGYVSDRGFSKSEVIIAEIMAGSGYFTQFLVMAGYRRIHAFEASNHMANDAFLKHKFITAHAIEGMFSIREPLRELKPNIVVSLAGFHHMLIYKDDGSIDFERSINKQKGIIDTCMNAVGKNGVVVIVDIRDDDLNDVSDRDPECWNTSSFKRIVGKHFAPPSCVAEVVRSRDLAEYSKALTKYLMPPLQINANPTTSWFHNVVDKATTIGHKDVPIGNKLIKLLDADYKLNISKINTPWVFSDVAQLRSYITSFWFLEHKNGSDRLRDVLEKGESINGIRTIDEVNKVTFGWNLSLLTIQNKDQDAPSLFYPNIVRLISILIALSALGIMLKIYTYMDVPVRIISNVLVFLVGVAAKEVYDKIKRK